VLELLLLNTKQNGISRKIQRYRTAAANSFIISMMTSPNVLRHINQETILKMCHHGNTR